MKKDKPIFCNKFLEKHLLKQLEQQAEKA